MPTAAIVLTVACVVAFATGHLRTRAITDPGAAALPLGLAAA
ncbi:hypothetical protein ACU686_03785 [Yinghuangia aomiensis]